MKSIVTLFILLPFFVLSYHKNLETEIDSVTIFTSDAQINRSKSVDLKKGENILYFKSLELELQPNSIQLSGANNNKNMTVISHVFSQELIKVPGQEKLLENINDSLFSIKQDIKLLNNRMANLQQEKGLILSHAKISYEKELNYVNIVESMLAYYRKSTLKIDRLMLDIEKKKAKKEVTKNELEIRLQGKLKNNYEGIIKAKIFAKESIKQKLQLSYLVSGVSWTPFYDIKSNGINKPLQVSCKATIHQNTGIDWKNISLKLSTRKKTALTAIPKVHPWVLHFQNSYKRYSQNNLIIDQQAISNSHIPTKKTIKVNQNNNAAQQNSTITNQYLNTFKAATHKMINKEYRSSLKHTISGKEGIAVMELDNFKMQTDYKYYAVPKYDQNVYLVAEIQRHQQYDLIPAFANIFLEGIYVGKLFINPEALVSKLDLMLGKDNDIIVDRRKVDQLSDKHRRIIGNIARTTIEIELLIKNRKNSSVDIILKDQVPVSGQEGIKVDVLKISGAQLDSTSGTLTWKKSLASSKSQKYSIKYEIERPKNKKLANF
ncbi:MAG: DUF4139 domain-containing protein [Crocinitomicaceae bacterium]